MPGLLMNDGKPLLASASAVETQMVIPADNVLGHPHHSFYLEWGAGTQAGEVTFESARSGYAGTWAVEAVVPWKAANKTQRVTLKGCFLDIRVRITKPVLGGTVDVYGCSQ